MPLRIALFGAGTFARNAHFDALLPLLRLQRVVIEVIWSRTEASAVQLAQSYESKPAVCFYKGDDAGNEQALLQSAGQVLEEYNVDAVILALPILQQPAFVRLCLSANVSVLFEKPLANDIATAKELVQLAKERDVMCAVAENFRFEAAFQVAKEWIKLLDDAISFNLTASLPMKQGSTYGRGWRLEMKNMGVALDVGVHLIAGLRVLMQSDVETVFAKCKQEADYFNGMDTTSCTMSFKNGVCGNMMLTLAGGAFCWTLVVVCKKGIVTMERMPGRPGYNVRRSYQNNGKQEEDVKQVEFTGVKQEIEAFVQSCESASLHDDLNATAAFNDLAAMEAMYNSHATGRVVNVEQL